jgi:pimeloyl-ACP methyl ester carboxylesterase
MSATFSHFLRMMVSSAAVLAMIACDAPAGRAPEQGASQQTDDAANTIRPTKSGYADVNGARFYYQIFGDLTSQKTPLLVLHGSYMSADAMAPFIQAFAGKRPVIALDARGHGRTGDLPGGITYAQLADDAAGVLDALKVRSADVLGYSMGGITALTMAVRHPDKVGKQIILSATSRRDGWYPELNKAFEQVTPAVFAGTPLEAEYKRLSPTPNAFPAFVKEMRDLDMSNYDLANDAVRKIDDKTMIVVGDADGVELERALELFRLRGGGDKKAVLQGFLAEAPRARLAILPATSHTGIMTNAEMIAEVATPFLDDIKPPLAPGFFKEPGGNQ